MSLAIVILLLLAAILFVMRFVQSRFDMASALPDEPNDGPDNPHSGIPVRRKGGPKGRVTPAEAEEPDEF